MKTDKKPTILTITGSDSTGGSGVQADIKTITLLGAYATSAITTVTAQDTAGIQHYYDIPGSVLKMQVDSIIADLQPDAVKIGMLRTQEQVSLIAQILRENKIGCVILDSVAISSRGNILMSKDLLQMVVKEIFPLCTAITIKTDSAMYLLDEGHPDSNDNLAQMARRLLDFGGKAVVLQGGAIAANSLTDVLVTADNPSPTYFTRPGFIDRNTIHGAGGAFSSALATFICKGYNMQAAIEHAIEYISQLILRNVGANEEKTKHILDHTNHKSQTAISTRMLELYNSLMNLIATHHTSHADVAFYANNLNVTSRYLAQITNKVAGRTPKDLIDDYIIKEVEAQLISTTKNIQEIAFSFGFSTQAQFNKFFKKMRGCAPTLFRKQNS